MPENPNDFSSSGMPFFDQIAKAMSASGPVQWDLARQFAMMSTNISSPEANVEPTTRISLNQLAQVADLHVRDVSGLSTTTSTQSPSIEVVNRSTWIHHTLEAFKFYFSNFSVGAQNSIGDETGSDLAGDDADGMDAMMTNLTKLMTPAMLGMSVGSMVGQLSLRAFGQYDLPLPRLPKTQLIFLARNCEEFANDWSIKVEDMQMWSLIQELAFHRVFQVEHVRELITESVKQHVSGFKPNPNAFGQRLSNIDVADTNPAEMMQRLLGDPTILLGAERTAQQKSLAPVLDALICTIVCYVDRVVDVVAGRILGNGAQISEAVRRRRVEASAQDQYVEELFGIHLTDAQLAGGDRFIKGVVERAGEQGLAQLWSKKGNLPTPNEISAPGLWLERISL
ncbi:MAG: zinc-dependent metalloprotease [Actinomycetota bacterium]